MATDHRAILAKIKRFDQLIAYLRDEMGWPIAQDSFDDVDDLFYDFTPEELGIDEKNAAKIQEIKRLRPLSTKQKWGIFFVKFEPKKLPVVALRRILSKVVLKTRASANSSERAAWSTDDLLFISNYGEGESRQISFAHFTEDKEVGNLAALNVLGWDGQDTGLHLDNVATELTDNLSWPDDENDSDAWREKWRSAFTVRHGEVIRTSKALAVRLAELAREIRKKVNSSLAVESTSGKHRKLMKSFQSSLIHDLDEDGFADMYAQTIAYGLLTARVSRHSGALVSDDAALMVPATSPFLKELMETFLNLKGRKEGSNGDALDFDELGVNDVVEMLRAANMEAVLRDFGDKNPEEDPVIHFYELFLKEYDAKKRMRRGVFFTPRPVVSFIVRSVDELLRTEFGLKDGLADTTTWGEMIKRFDYLKIPEGATPKQAFVQILDPATGTGTFLVEVIDLIHKTMTKKWQATGHGKKKIDQLWNEYVPKHLLPRLHGYELMMAPYAIAHMKIGLKLAETGYLFASDERTHVYLTNSLEPPQAQFRAEGLIPALAHEAEAVNTIKRDQRFTVVIGNPPYSGNSSNIGEWIRNLLRISLIDGAGSYFQVDGANLGERNPKWLNDDYVKFIRLCQYGISRSGIGVLSFITNHGYLGNPTFRGMRQSLCATFSKLFFLDLHGNSKIRERSPSGTTDQNVFEIQQGVAVGIYVRNSQLTSKALQVYHNDLWGMQAAKYEYLIGNSVSSIDWSVLSPCTSFYMFVPQDNDLRREYEQWNKVNEIMPIFTLGFQTHRDHFAIDLDESALRSRIHELRATKLSDAEISSKYDVSDNRDWKLISARVQLRSDKEWESRFIRCLYRPFDFRACYYSTVAMDYPRRELLNHVASNENLVLNISRIVKLDSWQHAIVSTVPATAIALDINGSYAFPLYLYPNRDKRDLFGATNNTAKNINPTANLQDWFVGELFKASKTSDSLSNDHGDGKIIEPLDVVAYIYALLYSSNYRQRYLEFLRIDFPRIPFAPNQSIFQSLAALGRDLIALHVMQSSKLEVDMSSYFGPREFQIEKVSFSDESVWIDKAKTCGFQGVPEEVWNFHIGGYQVCQKWLKDRGPKKGKPGRVLTKEDINHYQKIVVALSETIRIMTEIDKVIDKHGGWPGAFVTKKE